MANYGFPYKGSKNKIAKHIISQLPSGKRLVDLFGGGGAISHCAVESGKWTTVLYNEYNPLPYKLFKRAISGEFNYDNFKPEWVSREQFNEQKEQDGYIKYIWSFGNNGHSYLFGKNIENSKRILHNAVVFNDLTEIYKILPEFNGFDNCQTIKERRIFISKLIKSLNKNDRGLEQLEQLVRLETSCGDYRYVQLQDKDIIYCDPPYADTDKYDKNGFNHDEFWQWVRDCEHPVYVSEYSAPDDFVPISSVEKLGLLNPNSPTRKIKTENLYWNGK